MSVIGKVDSLWRHPVKSMRGEELDEAFAGFSGVYGDRLFAFRSSASPAGFPYLTAREQRRLLQYRPRFRYPDKAARPINLTEAESKGANPLSAGLAELVVDVQTPDGQMLAIDDPALIKMLRADIDQKHQLTLMQSQRAMTDCRPLSIFRKILEIGGEMPPFLRHSAARLYLGLSRPMSFFDKFFGRSTEEYQRPLRRARPASAFGRAPPWRTVAPYQNVAFPIYDMATWRLATAGVQLQRKLNA